MKRSRRTALAIAAAGAVVAVAALPVASAAPAEQKVSGGRPSWAVASADRGPTDPGTELEARVYLAGRDPQAMTAYALAVTDPHNAAYRHFLSAAEVNRRFGPTAEQTRAVTSWLKSSGLKVTSTDSHYVGFRGSVDKVQRAFDVQLHDFADANGLHRAPTGEVKVPARIASAVQGVVGLEDPAKQGVRAKSADEVAALTAPRATEPDPWGPSPALYRAEPCSNYWGEKPATDQPKSDGKTRPWTLCGYGPQELRKAYGLDRTSLTGRGVTVGIIDPYASPTIEADVAAYANKHVSQGWRPGQLKQYTTPGGSPDCFGGPPNAIYVEEALDIEAVHAMAPDADVAYVGAKDCSDPSLLDALNRLVDHHLADMVSNSWGDGANGPATEAIRQAYEDVFQRAAIQGIGVYFSSGDCGVEDPVTGCGRNEDSNGVQTEYPPESVWVTGVGGTTMALGPDYRKVFEAGWGNIRSEKKADGSGWDPDPRAGYPAAFTGGSGGGTSAKVRQPAYQAGVVPAKLARTLLTGETSAYPMRVVPDVAMDGDNNTGMMVGQTWLKADGTVGYLEVRLGGTSLSSPLMAGLQAVAQQAQRSPIGFANPQLYQRAGSRAFDDVTDTPFGPNELLNVVRNDYSNITDPTSPIKTRLYTFGLNGPIKAVTGYDDVTGVGTPSSTYAQSYQR
ncbi:subtilase family protein [Kribbella voronezhensis]|uniref:Subtilase family protein n=1 Tax=Kribbella voronezhensis TaxID=2512212 RepID=A0A4R7SWX3_9ACTN|nr:S53 family peptidase [Kribbella voronezhensis]TDU83731.1 subtilase family protein [Kribbella voronezhensis]